MKLTDKIKKRLLRWCQTNSYDIVLPNFYYEDYEMDVFKLSYSGICIEYEIKVSRSDYLRDFKKYLDYTNGTKHYTLLNGKRICNRFYFVMPTDMVDVSEVPSYCGLIYYDEKYDSLSYKRNGKILHRNKMEDYKELAFKLAYREEGLRRQKLYAERKLEEAEKHLLRFDVVRDKNGYYVKKEQCELEIQTDKC